MSTEPRPRDVAGAGVTRGVVVVEEGGRMARVGLGEEGLEGQAGGYSVGKKETF